MLLCSAHSNMTVLIGGAAGAFILLLLAAIGVVVVCIIFRQMKGRQLVVS